VKMGKWVDLRILNFEIFVKYKLIDINM